MKASWLGVAVNAILLIDGAAWQVSAQTASITTRDADGRIVMVRQNAGTSLGAYLGDAGAKRGALVGKVLTDSPAAKAGLVENDLIIGFGTERVESAAQVFQGLNARKPNESVPLKIKRNGTELSLSVTLADRRLRGDDPCQKLLSETNAVLAQSQRIKAQAEEAARKGDKKTATELTQEAEALFQQAEAHRLHIEKSILEGSTVTNGRKDGCLPPSALTQPTTLGVEVTALTPQLAAFFGLNALSGLLVTDVLANSPAAQAGFKAGDCLLSLNGKTPTSGFDLRRLYEEAVESVLSAAIVRDGKNQTLSVTRR